MRRNAKLRDMNISVPAMDERAIEVLASGLEFEPRCAIGGGYHRECNHNMSNALTVDGGCPECGG